MTDINGHYTGREVLRLVSFVLQGGQFGIQEGFCVMSIRPIPEAFTSSYRVEELKIWPEYLDAIIRGLKSFEVRRNDRNFQPNTVLKLREWIPAFTPNGNHLSTSGATPLRIRQPSDSTGLSLAGVRVAIPETPCLHCQKPGATEKAFNLNGLLCGECHSEEIRVG